MAALTLKYNRRNMLITKFLDVLTHMKGVEVLEKEILIPEEMK